MNDFRLGSFPSSSALYVYSMRDSIWFDPPYQRSGDVWPLDKRQLLIDSIINGYDIPKLYFHEFFPAKEVDGRSYRYAIVDGKQRLQSIFEFIEGKYSLSDTIEYLAAPDVKLKGLTYRDLAREYPEIKTKFDGYMLPIVTIQTDEVELIEDMFSRLNEAVPLNAAEKRNALGGPIPPKVRSLVKHKFFKKKLPFTNRRYRHFDLATKFLFFEEKKELADTRKIYLDDFVRNEKNKTKVDQLARGVSESLDLLASTFVDEDPLLRSVGMVILYYFIAREARLKGKSLDRSRVLKFEASRLRNRKLAEDDVSKASYDLLEFDRLAQSLNDGIALQYRYRVLAKGLGLLPRSVKKTKTKKKLTRRKAGS